MIAVPATLISSRCIFDREPTKALPFAVIASVLSKVTFRSSRFRISSHFTAPICDIGSMATAATLTDCSRSSAESDNSPAPVSMMISAPPLLMLPIR